MSVFVTLQTKGDWKRFGTMIEVDIRKLEYI